MTDSYTSSVHRRATLVLFFFVSVTPAAIAQTTFYVNGACGDDSWTATSPDCQAPDGPKATIQAGIDASTDGDTVIVADGTYTGVGNRDLDFAGRLITLRSENGPECCIIDCQGEQARPRRGFYFHSQETADAVLEGFTIQNGYVTTYGDTELEVGGGMFLGGSSPTVINCTFRWNEADYWLGGAVFAYESSATLVNCTFRENSADGGGAIYAETSDLTLVGCVFSRNSALMQGGGMWNAFSSPVVTDCVFIGNSGTFGGGMLNYMDSCPVVTNCTFIGNSSGIGGGMLNDIGSHPTVTNCKFTRNSADLGGGMFNISGSSPTVTNCTFSENSADQGGAISSYDDDDYHTAPIVNNCVLWGNSPDQINEVDGATTTIRYSNIQGGWAGEGNIDQDPLFVPGPLGCYYLSQIAAGQSVDSPGVDTGDPASPLVDGTTRSDEGLDIGVVDMGYHHPISGLPLVMGDSDHDSDVDLADFAGLQSCFTGEGPSEVSPCCRIFDFEPDDDVDSDDYVAFHAAFTGP